MTDTGQDPVEEELSETAIESIQRGREQIEAGNKISLRELMDKYGRD